MPPEHRSAAPVRISIAALLLAVALGPGCRPAEAEPPALRIAISAWPGYEFFFVARDRGFFADEGLRVEIVEFGALADSREAYERGQVQAFCGTTVEALQASLAPGRRPRIVHVCDWSNGGDVLLSRKRIAGPKDLRGRRVGLELASLNVYVLSRALEGAGLGLGDVTLVPTAQETLPDRWRAGEIDAAVSYAPHSQQILGLGDAHAIFDTKRIPKEVVDLVAVDAAWLEAHPNTGAALSRAFSRALEWACANPEQSWPAMARREGLSTEDFLFVIREELVLCGDAEQAAWLGPDGALPRILEKTAHALKACGALTADPPLSSLIAGRPR